MRGSLPRRELWVSVLRRADLSGCRRAGGAALPSEDLNRNEHPIGPLVCEPDVELLNEIELQEKLSSDLRHLHVYQESGALTGCEHPLEFDACHVVTDHGAVFCTLEPGAQSDSVGPSRRVIRIRDRRVRPGAVTGVRELDRNRDDL